MYTITAEALNSCIRASSKNAGLDPVKSASRYFCDRLIHHFEKGFGPLPFAVKGGLMWPQTLRETEDADLQVSRRYSQAEVDRAFDRLAPVLLNEGIVIDRVHPEREIFVGAPESISRHHINAHVGSIRIATDLDLCAPVGPYAWPRHIASVTVPSFLPNTPATSFRSHTLETSAAEKWWFQLNQDWEDFRVKHMSDLVHMSNMGLDSARVASELIRIARYHGHAPGEIPLIPETFRDRIQRKSDWDALSHDRQAGLQYYPAHTALFGWWQKVHKYMDALLAHDRRKMHASVPASRHPQFYAEYGAAPADNVVAFRPR